MNNESTPLLSGRPDLVAHYAALCPVPVTETIPLAQAAGRVLATDVHADRDQPPFDRSTRDGYALRAEDLGRSLNLIGLCGRATNGAALP